MTDVFISYAESDKTFVQRLTVDLRLQGLTVWMDEYLKAGDDWASAIATAIDGSRNVLVILSVASFRSEVVRLEAAMAVSRSDKRVVPVFLTKTVEVPFILRALHSVDLSRPETYEATVNQLAETLRESGPPEPRESELAHKARARRVALERNMLEQERLRLELVSSRQSQTIVTTTLSLSLVGVFVGIGISALVTGSVPEFVGPVGLVASGVIFAIVGYLSTRMLLHFLSKLTERDSEKPKLTPPSSQLQLCFELKSV